MLVRFARFFVFISGLLLAACTPVVMANIPTPQEDTASSLISPAETETPTATLSATIMADTPAPLATETAFITPTQTETGALPVELALDPAEWHHWPIIPIITEKAQLIYQLGQSLGNDAHAFSVLGDCQSEPKVFMGVYETDPVQLAGLPPDLQQTVAWFTGSFSRDAPTIRGGTTAGSLLWPDWHQNRYTCTIYESPLQCELRIHNPSFVFIHVGTHYESRNEIYTRKVVDQLITAGVLPILVTKADDRELDEHVNLGYAQLAVEYDIPLWNFWAAVESLPNRGLFTREEVEFQGDVYLTDIAVVIHRLTALQTLDAVWRAVEKPK
jgi:hypothetical protein